MHLCLFEDDHVSSLRPLVETRPVYDVRLGLRTIVETTLHALEPDGLLLHTRPQLGAVTASAHTNAVVNAVPEGVDVLFVNGRLVAGEREARSQLQTAVQSDDARAYVQGDTLVAAWVPNAARHSPDDLLSQPNLTADAFADLPTTPIDDGVLVEYPWDLLDTLRPALRRDIESHIGNAPPSFPLAQRPYARVHDSVQTVNPERIHLGDGATIRPGAILNAHNGPIFIGANAEVGEQAVLRGPCAIGRESQVKIGANLEGMVAGPVCKVAGEIHDAIIHGYSNKSHPGFLGHSYVGAWCNIGADTNTSNLKNDYGTVSAYSPEAERLLDTGRQFAGLFMGDHSKCGINTMFNTGTVVGTNSNIFGGDFPPRYVPPFSWGGPSSGFTEYRLEKALDVAEHVMARRDVSFTDAHRALFEHVFEATENERDAHHHE